MRRIRCPTPLTESSPFCLGLEWCRRARRNPDRLLRTLRRDYGPCTHRHTVPARAENIIAMRVPMSNHRCLIKFLLIFSLFAGAPLAAAKDAARQPASPIGVGAQYDTTHVYVAPDDIDRFVSSFLATFGGQSTKQVVATVTPTPSSTTSQLLQTPVGDRLAVRIQDSDSISLRSGADRLSGHRHRQGNQTRKGSGCGHSGGRLSGSNRPRCRNPMAWRREYAALLAHDQAVICCI